MLEHPTIDDQANSSDPMVEETGVDVEIVEEGEEAETAEPTPSMVKGWPDPFLATYRVGR